MKHILLSIGLLLSAAGLRAELIYLEQISVETFAKMREVERFQIKVAEKFYLKGSYVLIIILYHGTKNGILYTIVPKNTLKNY